MRVFLLRLCELIVCLLHRLATLRQQRINDECTEFPWNPPGYHEIEACCKYDSSSRPSERDVTQYLLYVVCWFAGSGFWRATVSSYTKTNQIVETATSCARVLCSQFPLSLCLLLLLQLIVCLPHRSATLRQQRINGINAECTEFPWNPPEDHETEACYEFNSSPRPSEGDVTQFLLLVVCWFLVLVSGKPR